MQAGGIGLVLRPKVCTSVVALLRHQGDFTPATRWSRQVGEKRH